MTGEGDPAAGLMGLFDFEKQRMQRPAAKVFTLDRVRAALVALGRPDLGPRVVHVAGTKGKGSTVEYLYRLLHGAFPKMRIGIFTSPHLLHMRERIRVGDECIADDSLRGYTEILDRLNRRDFDGELTFFEVLLLMALLHFRDSSADMILLETGLGGRLDATNAVQAELSLLTRIDYDHMDLLGHDICQIAAEKAGIIKGNRTLALRQRPEVNAVFERTARECGAELHWFDMPGDAFDPRLENASLALRAAGILFPGVSDWPAVEDVAARPVTGRMQAFSHRGQAMVLDAAHNEVSLRALAAFLQARGGDCEACYSMAQGRDPVALLNSLLPAVKKITFCPLPGGRPGISPNDLRAALHSMDPGFPAEILPDHEDSLRAWLERPYAGTKVVTGSFYMVGEAMRQLGVKA